MTKDELRIKYKQLRAMLTDSELTSESMALANKLLELPIWDQTYYHIFLPITRLREVNSEYVLHLLWGKDKEIVVSRSDFASREMTHFLLTDSTKIALNAYDIPEPVNGLPVPIDYIDVVFVPLLAFDNSGNRIGYGKGFYDKFLGECKPATIKIGLSLFEAEDHFPDVFETDVRLDYCVTPKKIYKFT